VPIQPTKIVIAPESTKPIARWDYLGIDGYGWQEVIDQLTARGYEIHNISYEHTLLLRGVHSHAGNADIRTAIRHICEARLFIGLSSGLAWLAWAYSTPVVMIAGFTKPHNEFPCYRVENPYACAGCFNVLPNIQRACPLFQGTPREHECHRTITPAMVLAQVYRALNTA
jgi:autotransporter strand-loop-strand O-heptosyltransferase